MADKLGPKDLVPAKTENPRFYDIVDEFQRVIDNFDVINRKLLGIGPIERFPSKQLSELKALLPEIEVHNQKVSNFDNKVMTFIGTPQLEIMQNQDKALVSIYSLSVLRDMKNYVLDDMNVLANSYHWDVERCRSQRNENRTLLGLSLALIGLSISVGAFVFSIHSSTVSKLNELKSYKSDTTLMSPVESLLPRTELEESNDSSNMITRDDTVGTKLDE